MMNIDKDIGDNPSPQQVKDYYDLHTGEGAANFSSEDTGITVQLWHSLAQALEENERLWAIRDSLAELLEPDEPHDLGGPHISVPWVVAKFDALKEGTDAD